MKSHNIAHKDIKPQNIILDQLCQTFMLADFGASQDFNVEHIDDRISGTPCYMSPELLLKLKYEEL
ncbi:MAG: hypothetical protein H8E55_51890 [Pelagibacterales bacterium]|nr:hypothetical protein [Pelagibacterales bacterium]